MKAKKFLKAAIIGLAAILALVIIFGVVVYVILQTSLIEKKLLPIALEKLEKNSGIKATVQHARVKILSSLDMSEISVVFPESEGLKAVLNIDSLEVGFSPWQLLKKKFFVKSVEIVKPSLKATVSLSKLRKEEDDKEFSLDETIQNILDGIPFSKVRTAIFINDASADITEMDRGINLSVLNKNFSLQLELRKEGASTRVQTKLAFGDEESVFGVKYEDISVNFLYDVDLNLSGEVRKVNANYLFNLSSLNSEYLLEYVVVQKNSQKLLAISQVNGNVSAQASGQRFDETLPDSGKDLATKAARLVKDVWASNDSNDSKDEIMYRLSLAGDVKFRDYEALTLRGDIRDIPGEIRGKLNISAKYDNEKFKGYLKNLKDIPLKRFGLHGQIDFQAPYDRKSIFHLPDRYSLMRRAKVAAKTTLDLKIDKSSSKLAGLPVAEIPVRVENWAVSLDSSVDMDTKKVSLDFTLSNGMKDFTFALKGFTGFDMEEAVFDGYMKLKPYYPFHDSRSAKGSLSLPFRINALGKKTFDFTGKLEFAKFWLSNNFVELEEVTGRIPFAEKVRLLSNKKLTFSYIYDENPFNRADYVAIKPYVSPENLFTLKARNIKKGSMSVGPLWADIVLDQNMFKAERLRVKLFGGDFESKFFFNVLGGEEEVGFIGLFSNIDPRRIIDSRPKQERDPKLVSGQLDIIYDINSSDLEGRIDINEIGREQLQTLADVVDPARENSNLNSLRQALKLAYPTYVGVKMERGFFDLKVRMPVLKMIKRKGELEFRGLPLAPLVALYSRDLKAMVDKSPIR